MHPKKWSVNTHVAISEQSCHLFGSVSDSLGYVLLRRRKTLFFVFHIRHIHRTHCPIFFHGFLFFFNVKIWNMKKYEIPMRNKRVGKLIKRCRYFFRSSTISPSACHIFLHRNNRYNLQGKKLSVLACLELVHQCIFLDLRLEPEWLSLLQTPASENFFDLDTRIWVRSVRSNNRGCEFKILLILPQFLTFSVHLLANAW